MTRNTDMMIGLISDTHNLLRPESVDALQGVDRIIHAGDVCHSYVLEALRQVAPVEAVRGNCDLGEWAQDLPESLTLDCGGLRIHVVHDRKTMSISPRAENVAAVISGHSHQPSLEDREGVLFINPGSAGPRRFQLPIMLARMVVEDGKIHVEFIEI